MRRYALRTSVSKRTHLLTQQRARVTKLFGACAVQDTVYCRRVYAALCTVTHRTGLKIPFLGINLIIKGFFFILDNIFALTRWIRDTASSERRDCCIAVLSLVS